MARTAVVAGTASAVAGRVQRRQANKFAEQDAQTYAKQQQAYDQQYQPPPQYAPPPAEDEGTDDMLDQLKQLGELKSQGILTEEEFAAQKAKILAR
jgi:hypothetical protein